MSWSQLLAPGTPEESWRGQGRRNRRGGGRSRKGGESKLNKRVKAKRQVGNPRAQGEEGGRDEPQEGFPSLVLATPGVDTLAGPRAAAPAPPPRPPPLWGAQGPACAFAQPFRGFSLDRGCVPEAADAIGVGLDGLRLPSVHPPSISLPSLGEKKKIKRTELPPLPV